MLGLVVKLILVGFNEWGFLVSNATMLCILYFVCCSLVLCYGRRNGKVLLNVSLFTFMLLTKRLL